MTTPVRIRASVLFLVATGFGVSSTAQSYWLQRLNGEIVGPGGVWQLLALNLVYWYVPALLAPAIMELAVRFPLSRFRWPAQVAIHAAGTLVYSVLHTGALAIARFVMWMAAGRPLMSSTWWQTIGREYLTQLDWLVMTYLFLVGLAHALAYRRESEARALTAAQLETKLVQAQLQALQHQIQPHFLFNTLNTISGLVSSNPDAADRMIAGLGGLLRTTLHVSGTQEVPLERELDVLRQYLEIEQVRLGGRLHVATSIQPETRRALVPNLILQPLAENAVRHGIAPNARPGWIEVRAEREQSQLMIQVRDSGKGLSPDCLSALNGGVGLSNTRARLEHLYPATHQCLFSNLADGFSVTIRIPYRLAEPAATEEVVA